MTTMRPSARFSLGSAFVVLAASFVFSSLSSAADLSVVQRWMATNSGVNTVKINFTQTRTMRSLKIPIRQTGTLWMDYRYHRFRWQTGDPAQTIVVRRGSKMTIVRTPLKKYEVRPYGSGGGAPGISSLAGGFPRTMSEFQQKYRVTKISKNGGVYYIATQPLGSAGRGVSSFTFVVGADDYRLRGMEIALKDGSSVDTIFHSVRSNVSMPNSLFSPSLEGYRKTTFGS